VATLGGTTGLPPGGLGETVVNAIKSAGVTNYTINLMTMDFGAASPYVCVVSGGVCNMGASSVQAALALHTVYGVPYNHIEITPMIGRNDNSAEIFSIADAATLSTFVRQNGLAGVHFWSLDRDKNCGAGDILSTCDYLTAGAFGFTNAFISDLGL
jgi:chitinase